MSDQIVAILVPPGAQAEIQSERTEALSTIEQLRAWPCETAEDEQDLADILTMVKDKHKDLEEKRTTITGPLNVAKRAVDALFKPAKDALEEAEGIIKRKLAEADKRRELARKEAQRQLQEAAAKARLAAEAGKPPAMEEVKAAQAALVKAPMEGTQSAPAGVQFRYEWKWDLENPEDISEVPQEFLALNPAAMKKYTSAYRNAEEIPPVPGIVFRRERIVVSAG